MSSYRKILLAATLLAFIVVSLGAYVRLSDAGLGCPDWPGCYGHLIGVPDTLSEKSKATELFPKSAVEPAKAWKEMIHRYIAGTLGLLILALTVLAWRYRIVPMITSLLAAIVAFQAALGMWTVTLLLKPVIVTAHLLGGLTIVSLLVLLILRNDQARPLPIPRIPMALAPVALLVLIVQIMLGGWVSSNYAALACTDFPLCRHDEWWPAADFAKGFSLLRELGEMADGGLLPFTALTAIHLAHRTWALVVLLIVGSLAWCLMRNGAWRIQGLTLAFLLFLQVALGISTVLFSLPLPLAVAHNFCAALLLAWTVSVNARLWSSFYSARRDLWIPAVSTGRPMCKQ